MNEQRIGEQFNTADQANQINKEMNIPAANPDPFVDKAPVYVPLAGVSPMYDGMPVQEMPMKEPEVVVGPMVAMITREAPASLNFGSLAALINREESERFRTRWNEIQNKFVDEPRSAVQQADALVSEVIEQITRMFADEHGALEGQ